MLERMKGIANKLEKYRVIKEKAGKVKEWNDIVHKLDDLMSDYGHELPSRVRENIENIINYTEPPQTEFSEVDSLQSDLEDAIDAFEHADFSDQQVPVYKSTIILAGIAIALVVAVSVAFYFTQYANPH